MEDTLKKKLEVIDKRNRETFSIRRIANGFTVKAGNEDLNAYRTLDEVIAHMRRHYS